MISDLVKLRVSLYPGLPDEARRIVLTHSVSIEGEDNYCVCTVERHHVEAVQRLMAVHVGALPASEALREGAA